MNQNTLLEDSYEDQVIKGLSLDRQEMNGIEFSGCTFLKCSFEEVSFTACRFYDCSFKKCNLNLARIDGAVFRNTRFEDSKVIGVNWVKAAWGKPGLRQPFKSIDFYKSTLNYSSFMGLSLPKIMIQKCIARDVDFSDASLKQADFSFTDFTNAVFRHTDLTEANFVGATNYFIQPALNTLKKARFSLPEAMTLLYNLDIEIQDPEEDLTSIEDHDERE